MDPMGDDFKLEIFPKLGWVFSSDFKSMFLPKKNMVQGWAVANFLETSLEVEVSEDIPKKQTNCKTRWWQLKHFWKFHPLFGEDEPILTSIFFKGVETTN